MFGLSDVEKELLMHLYERRDFETNPPHQELSIRKIAVSLGLTQREVREAMKTLIKRLYAHQFTYEGLGYCSIKPQGIKEIEKETTKSSEFGIDKDGPYYKRKKTEDK